MRFEGLLLGDNVKIELLPRVLQLNFQVSDGVGEFAIGRGELEFVHSVDERCEREGGLGFPPSSVDKVDGVASGDEGAPSGVC